MYNPLEDVWQNFSTMRKSRDESSIAKAGNLTYIIGGIGERSVEYVDMRHWSVAAADLEQTSIPKSRQQLSQQKVNANEEVKKLPEWKLGPSLPDVRARACAAADTDVIYVFGQCFFFPFSR